MISISNATSKDADQLINFFSHFKIKDYIEKRIDAYLTCNHTIVAKDGEKIIGTIQWLIKEDPNLGVVEFEEINVLFAYQKQVIGSQLLTAAINSVKDYFIKNNLKLRKIYLFVSETNLAAQNFYKKFGFNQEAIITNLFSDSANELFFVLDLTS
ncbi:MAG: GNAT family N-acetyltransferase [Candidatus Shapirobacteria bacterium]